MGADRAVDADKAYSSRSNPALLRSRGITAVIVEPSDQVGHRKRRGSKGGRPPRFDADAYKGRNLIERSFNVLKQWRGLAVRYDKLALTYRGGVVLGAIVSWLRELGDMPCIGPGASRPAYLDNAAYVASQHGLAGLANASFWTSATRASG